MTDDDQTPRPCPECGTVRRNVTDGENGYCPRCHWWTFDPQMARAWRTRWPEKAIEARAYKQAHSVRVIDQWGIDITDRMIAEYGSVEHALAWAQQIQALILDMVTEEHDGENGRE